MHTNYSYKQHRDDALRKTFAILPQFKAQMRKFMDEEEKDMTERL